jgi:hypothetical protein
MRQKVWEQVGMRTFTTRTKDRTGNFDPSYRRDQNPIRGVRQQYWDKTVREIEWVKAIGLPQGGDQWRLASAHAEADDGTTNAQIE